jgi:hypothetical protein
LIEQICGNLQRQARLACAAHAGERDQAMFVDGLCDLFHFIFTPDEAGQLRRQVVAI